LSPAERAEPLIGVLETCLYHSASETPAVKRFYEELLGLPLVSQWPGGMGFRIGTGMLLLFEREELARRDSPIAAHVTTGPGHACLLAGGSDPYQAWKTRLGSEGIELTHEQTWPGDVRSVYFEDPAGNLLEIAEGDLWPSTP
jgi:catechol 2,3-dioxygenase-like lactoylglutathione lyase family enzyme